MRIPTNIPLETYIMRLMKSGEIYKFYWTDDWRELSRKVREDFNNECQMCKAKGIYTRVECVHHVNELKDRPDLALSRTYIDAQGKEQIQLMPLCNKCHNIIHDKFHKKQKMNAFKNKERW